MSTFDEFFLEHEQRLIRLAWLLSLDREDAVDLAQETLTRAWRDWDTIASGVDANPAAWTNRVLVNLSSNRHRRRATRRRWKHLFDRPQVAESPTTHRDLHRALAQLPQRQRQAIVLRYWHDLDLAGCADVMGVSVGSVKTHLSRAHSSLRADPHQLLEES
jgi:RNA polymerase sigma-70 factor (sigma-E family)